MNPAADRILADDRQGRSPAASPPGIESPALRHPPPSKPFENQLLEVLSPASRDRVLPHLQRVRLRLGQVLYQSDGPLEHVYFPNDSIVSLQSIMESGASAEISLVGNEGLVGVALFMSGGGTPSRAVVQSAGSAYRLRKDIMKAEFDRHEDMLVLVLRYTQALLTQTAQTAVCNRHHSIDQQLCRRLLLWMDRLPAPHLVMTHELIANMLGVRREGVTAAAGKLQSAGVIRYTRGKITVLNRSKLEALSCECYAAVKAECDRLLPWSALSSSFQEAPVAAERARGALSRAPGGSPAQAEGVANARLQNGRDAGA